MEQRPMFSLVIPCHNPDKFIRRLINSINNQHVPKEDLEVIIVDDNSDSLDYTTKLKCFYDTIIIQTHTDIHCPGNTRSEGLHKARGQWIFFCDQDDFFEDGALLKVKKYILENNIEYVLATIMRGYNDIEDTFHGDFARKSAWLHGKFYSMDNLIKPYGIDFKKDLVTHEDIYFNSCTISTLFLFGRDWDYYDINTYRWVDNPDSLSRRKTEDRGYLFENFQDYIDAAAEPYWDMAIKGNPYYINQVMMTLLHCYFYYEAASYYYGPKDYVDIIEKIKHLIQRILIEIQFTLDDIIDFVYYDADKYWKVFEDCKIYCGTFIPKTSFRDFVYRLGQ